MRRLKKLHQKGFTIIELMIATAVLSTILLLVTILMVNIGHLYFKGINQARVQDNVRTITDEVAQQLKLGSSIQHQTGDNNQEVYCVGTKRYTFIRGVQIGTPAPGSSAPVYQHILWRDDNPETGTCNITGDHKVDLTAAQPSTGQNGSELIAPKSRLMHFSISGTSPYSVSAGVAYGDNDLLCSPSVSGSCQRDAPEMVDYSDFTSGKLLCKNSQGSQFCATAQLNTSVIKRLP